MGGSSETWRVGTQFLVVTVTAVLSGFGDILIYHSAKRDNWRLLAGGIGIWLVSLLLMGLETE